MILRLSFIALAVVGFVGIMGKSLELKASIDNEERENFIDTFELQHNNFFVYTPAPKNHWNDNYVPSNPPHTIYFL